MQKPGIAHADGTWLDDAHPRNRRRKDDQDPAGFGYSVYFVRAHKHHVIGRPPLTASGTWNARLLWHSFSVAPKQPVADCAKTKNSARSSRMPSIKSGNTLAWTCTCACSMSFSKLWIGMLCTGHSTCCTYQSKCDHAADAIYSITYAQKCKAQHGDVHVVNTCPLHWSFLL